MENARLENWIISQLTTGDYVVNGTIYNDPKGRFADGARMRTSRLKKVDFVEGVVETRNSTYILGKRGVRCEF